jgi:signal transduction histidine kinase
MHGQLTRHRSTPEWVDATEQELHLDDVLARIDRAITSAQVAAAVVQGGQLTAGANSGAMGLLTPDRRELHVVYAFGDDSTRIGHNERLPVTARFPLCDVVRSRRELWLTDPDELIENYPDMAPTEGSRAWAALPLQIDGVILATVGWSFQRQWLTAYQRACLRSLAEAGGVALYRAGVFDSERATRMRVELNSYDAVRRGHILADVNSSLDAAAETDNITKPLEEIARMVLPRLGEWCCVQLVNEHGQLSQAAEVHIDPAKDRLLSGLLRGSAHTTKRIPAQLSSGSSVVVASLSADTPRISGLSTRQVQVLRTFGLQRALIVPMYIHGQTLGMLSFGTSNSTITYAGADLDLAETVARRCAAWLEYNHLQLIADRAQRAREDFVAATSHELRTPLSHIKGFVSTLRTGDIAWDAATRDDFLAEIEQEADRLASLISGLLDLSRIDSGGLEPSERDAVSPAALVAAGIDRVRPSVADRYLDLQLSSELPMVWAHSSHVERVIANLLDNALKYSPPDQPVVINARAQGNFVVFRVEDRGLGIPPAHMERIFEPFFREPTGSYPAKPGTGLGLAICRSIIRSQHGRIWAEQRSGGGAVLAFTLPIARDSQERT